MTWFRRLAWVLLAGALVGCQTGATLTANPGDAPAQTAPLAAIPEQALTPAPVEEPPLPNTEEALPQPSAEPLRFTLPTPAPLPNSLWRPPLYETPWALSAHDHFYFARPMAADVVNWPLADYRYGGIFTGLDIVHTGIDIPNRRGTPVLAAGGGKIIWAGYGLYMGTNDPKDPYGLAVTIQHDFGYNNLRLYTVYAHMDRIDVITGQRVETGQQLGIVGMTGNTTGPHLHFEVRTERNSYYTTLNPELWLVPPQGWGVLVGRMLNTNGSLLTEQDIQVTNLDTRQNWTVRTYGRSTVNPDPYYKENLVLSDLPAGHYQIRVYYLDERYTTEVDIHAGAVTYINFKGEDSFFSAPPPGPAFEMTDSSLNP